MTSLVLCSLISNDRSFLRFAWLLWLVACALLVAPAAHAGNLYINEIFFNQPSQKNNPTGDPFTPPDSTHAYVELRGTPFATLHNTFLVFLENEGQIDPMPGDAGSIELFFDLSGVQLGANGYLTLRQKTGANPQYNDYAVNPKARDLKNTGSGPGFGSAETSTIGAYSFNENTGLATGEFEGSGFTALLIQTDGSQAARPVLSEDLDVDNMGGFDVVGGKVGWTTLDAIAVFGERSEAEFGRTYAPLTFGFDSPSVVTWLQPGQEYVRLQPWPNAEREAEYIGRWGNSTGNAPEDWHVSNVTDRAPDSGFANKGDFRQSADPHGSSASGQIQSNHPGQIVYGEPITTTLGGPNYPLNKLTPQPGDFDGDGDVDADDLHEQWVPRFAGGDLTGADLLTWQRNYHTIPASVRATAPIPEPATATLVMSIVAALSAARRR